MVSINRFEKPHSLSYQATSFTWRLSCTLVSGASKMVDAGLPMISDDTKGSSVYYITPPICCSDASLRMALISATVVSAPTLTTKSTSEPVITGTRTE